VAQPPADYNLLAHRTGRSFLAGTDAGEVRQYQRRGHAYNVTWSRGLGGPAVDGVGMLSTGEMAVACDGRLALYSERDAPERWRSEDYGVQGAVTVGIGPNCSPLAGGSYALVSLAPWTTLMDVRPRSGPSYGGTLLTVSGTSFDPAAQLYVGARPALGPQVLGPTVATGTTPALPRCSLNTVTVVNPDMSFEVLEDAFRARHLGCVFPEAWTTAPTPPCSKEVPKDASSEPPRRTHSVTPCAACR
jgi:hypothetical protein